MSCRYSKIVNLKFQDQATQKIFLLTSLLVFIKIFIKEYIRVGFAPAMIIDKMFTAQVNKLKYIGKMHNLANKVDMKVSLLIAKFKKESLVVFKTTITEYFKAHTGTSDVSLHYLLCDESN